MFGKDFRPFCEIGRIAHGLREEKIFLFLLFTPLESPAGCSGDEDKILFRANTGFKAPCEPTHWKVENLLTGFTFFIEFEKSIHGLLGKFRGIEVKVELNDRDLLNNVHL